MAPDPKTTTGLRKPVILDDKIKAARGRQDRYIPSQREWDNATKWQRENMTWPGHILDAIRRSS